MVTELQDQGTSIDDALDTQTRDGPEDWRAVHQHKQPRCSDVNDPRGIVFHRDRARFHPEHAIDRRIGARRSNRYGRARLEVGSFPFFNLGLENAGFDAVVFKLARPTQLHSAGGESLRRRGRIPCRVRWLALAGAGHCERCQKDQRAVTTDFRKMLHKFCFCYGYDYAYSPVYSGAGASPDETAIQLSLGISGTPG